VLILLYGARMDPSDETSSLMLALEQTRIATEEIERRVVARHRRIITQPYLTEVVARLPLPPPVPGEADEQRVVRSVQPTQKIRSPVARVSVEPESTR
jgi:hypothetical protein